MILFSPNGLQIFKNAKFYLFIMEFYQVESIMGIGISDTDCFWICQSDYVYNSPDSVRQGLPCTFIREAYPSRFFFLAPNCYNLIDIAKLCIWKPRKKPIFFKFDIFELWFPVKYMEIKPKYRLFKELTITGSRIICSPSIVFFSWKMGKKHIQLALLSLKVPKLVIFWASSASMISRVL